jgi:hypothetical protein
MSSTRVHTLFGTQSPIAPAGTFTGTFNLNQNNRSVNIKSLLYDLRIFNSGTFQILPINNNYFWFNLLIGSDANNKIGSIFENISGTWASYTGQGFTLLRPQFVLFDSFFIRNALPCTLYVENHDAAISIGFYVTIVMEVEIID